MVHVEKGLGDPLKGIDRPHIRRELMAAEKGKNLRHGLLGGIVGEKARQIACVADSAALFHAAQGVSRRVFGPTSSRALVTPEREAASVPVSKTAWSASFSKDSFPSL